MRCLVWLGLSSLLSLLGASPLRAHPASKPLTFAQSMQQAEASPPVKEVQAALSQRRAGTPKISSMTHNPQLSVEAGYRDDTGGTGAVVQVAIQQGFYLSGYRAARRQSIDDETTALTNEVVFATFRQKLAVIRQWMALWAQEQVEQLAEEEVELAAQIVARTERLFQAGAATQLDVATAQTYLAEQRAQLLSAEGEVVEQGLSLGRTIGSNEAVHAAGNPDPVTLPPLLPSLIAEAVRRIAQLPEPRQKWSQVQVEHAHAHEAVTQRGSQLWLGALALREPTAPYAVFGTLSLSIPAFDRGQREQTEFLAGAARQKVAAQAAEQSAQIELKQTLHDVEHFGQLSKILDETLLPAAQKQVALRERLQQAGDGTILEVLLSRRSLVSARAQAARARASLASSQHRLALYLSALGLRNAESAP